MIGRGWINEPRVFIDRGRRIADGPPLLKERRHLKKPEQITLGVIALPRQ